MEVVQLTTAEVAQVVALMHDLCGNDFSDKPHLVAAKMGSFCMHLGYERFCDLWGDLQGHSIAAAELRQQLIDELTTSYSYFYRESKHFDRLADFVREGSLPVGVGPLRVWSAGCASGEEPYNIAMALEDLRRAGQLPLGYQVIASDIASDAISLARAGSYDWANCLRMPSVWRARHCQPTAEGCEVGYHIRSHVEFRLENVLEPRPSAAYDVVWCRNMIIYFDQKSIERFCTLLRGLVKPGGYLFLGHSEILSDIKGFTYLEPSIWRRDAAVSGELGTLTPSVKVPMR